MDKLHLTSQEEDELLLFLERYLPDLKNEIARSSWQTSFLCHDCVYGNPVELYVALS